MNLKPQPEWTAECARVALVLNDIKSAECGERDRLLEVFLSAAWPAERGQRQ